MFSKAVQLFPLNLKKNYVELSFFLLALCIPASRSFTRPALITCIAFLLFRAISSKDKFSKSRIDAVEVLMILFFLIHVFTIVIYPPIDFYQLEKRISLIVLPLLFILARIVIDQNMRTLVMRGFILGNFFLSMFNLAKATYHSISVKDGSIHFDSTIWGNIPVWESIDHVGNYYFSLAFSDFIHPSYWSLFLTVSIVIIWLENPFQSKRWVRVCAIVFFLFILFLCSSKAGIVTTFFTVIILILVTFKLFTTAWVRWLIIFFIVGSIGLMFLNPRMSDFIRSVQEGSVKEALRVGSWLSAIEIVKENPVLGVGLQHAESEMTIQYRRLGFEEHIRLELNAHNQFLETAVVTGGVGLAILLSIFFLVLKRAFQHRDILLFLVVFNLGFHCCVESMISRFHGVIFFSFIFLILYLSSKRVVRKSEKVPQPVIG